MRFLGVQTTISVAAAANICIALIIYFIFKPPLKERLSYLAPPSKEENASLQKRDLFILLSFAVSGLAALVYQVSKDRIELLKEAFAPLYDLLFHKYYIDELYDLLIVKPTKAIGTFMEERAEKQGIDFAVDEVGFQVKEVSRGISFWQSGRVRTYALNMVAGMVIILLFVVFI